MLVQIDPDLRASSRLRYEHELREAQQLDEYATENHLWFCEYSSKEGVLSTCSHIEERRTIKRQPTFLLSIGFSLSLYSFRTRV